MARVRFAAVLRPSDRGMTVSFGLPRRLEHHRISKIEDYGSGWYGHFVRVTSSEEMDDEMLQWLKESYSQMGQQRRFQENDP